MRQLSISRDLYRDLESHFERSSLRNLAPLRAYQAAHRRAVLFAGGRSTGTHAERRTSAQELKNREYWRERELGLSPREAAEEARRTTVEELGHSRMRKDVERAYIR